MKLFLGAFIFSFVAVFYGLNAFSAEPACQGALSELRQALGSNASMRPATPAQYHFLQGVWVMHPQTPAGLPPGDGAQIVTAKGHDDGKLVLTQKDKICFVLPLPKEMMALIKQLKDGPGEDM